MEPALDVRTSVRDGVVKPTLSPCPDCGTAPEIAHDDYGVEISCPNCNDTDFVDNQAVRYGRFVTASSRSSGGFAGAEAFAVQLWTELCDDAQKQGGAE